VSEPLKNQCLHFIECATQGKRPLTDGLAGLRVVQVMEAVEQSLARQGSPVTIPAEFQKSASPVIARYARNGVHR
jgi:predicted dehydrogenase